MDNRLVHHELEKQAYWRPDTTALVFEGTELTYGELDRRVNRLASALDGAGATEGSRMLAHGSNHVDWYTLFYACSKLGAVFCPVSSFQSLSNLAYIVDTLDPDYVFYTADEETVDDRLPTVRDAAPSAGYVSLDDATAAPSDATVDGFLAGDDGDRPAWADDHAPDDHHSVFWTSGTTGRPKAVVRDHSSSLHAVDNLLAAFPFDDTNVRLTTTSQMLMDAHFHYGIPTVIRGGTNVVIREFSAPAVFEAHEEYGVDVMHLGHVLAQLVLEYREEEEATLELRALSAVLQSSNKAEQLSELTDELYHIYGTTEIGLPLLHRVEPPFDDRPTLGKPIVSSDVRIVDPDDEGADPSFGGAPQPGDVGELACRGETTMTGYLDDEIHRENVHDGWIRPGDIFRVTDDRELVFVGRTDDRLRSGGVNVYPAEVEQVLEAHGAVENSVVVGVDDDRWGQRLCALVVRSADADEERLADELEERCLASQDLARELRPRAYRFVTSSEAVPSGALGKVDRDAIAEEFFGD